MIPKDPRIKLPHLTKSARDQSCVSCGVEDGTVVWAHLPTRNVTQPIAGSKVHDYCGAYLCHECHYEADHGEARNDVEWRWRCNYLSLGRAFREGVLK